MRRPAELLQLLGAVVWRIESSAGKAIVIGLYALGWLVAVASTFMLDHLAFFGLRQVFPAPAGRESAGLQKQWLYKVVRHPVMVGFLIAFWAAPVMTLGHLLFSAAATGYILVGTEMEERDLLAAHGEQYRRYREEVRRFLPIPRNKP